MRHTRLGRTGLSVSRLCLGTMTFGLQCDEAASRAILDRAAAGGITFLDTADVYPVGGGLETVGRTEEIVGRWLEGRRQDFVVATKCVGAMSARPWDRGASRKHVLDAIDGSLRRLRTDYVDLYQLHHWDAQTPIDESLRALDDVVRAGKARYVGCSNFHAYQVARALGRSETLNLTRFDSIQPRYNLLFRQIERELLPLCREEGIGVIPYNPLAAGPSATCTASTSCTPPVRYSTRPGHDLVQGLLTQGPAPRSGTGGPTGWPNSGRLPDSPRAFRSGRGTRPRVRISCSWATVTAITDAVVSRTVHQLRPRGMSGGSTAVRSPVSTFRTTSVPERTVRHGCRR